jgi:hypothetical protein
MLPTNRTEITMKKLLTILAATVAVAAAPANAATILTSVAADGTNHLAVPGSTTNMTFDLDDGTVAEATAKGLVATINGPAASRTTVISGLSPYGATVFAPNPYDGNGYFGIGVSPASLTLAGANGAMFSSISFFVGTLDSYNIVDLLDTAGNVIGSYNGVQMYDQNGALPPTGNIASSAINRRITFTGTNGTTYGGIRFANSGKSNQAFEFDNVSFTAPVAAAVPEPATWAMMLIGFGAIGAAVRRRRNVGSTAAVAA